MKPTRDSSGIHLLEPGDRLCHYMSLEGLIGICSGEFWATKSGYLNDVTEFQVATEVFNEVMRERIDDDRVYRQLVKKVAESSWNGREMRTRRAVVVTAMATTWSLSVWIMTVP